MQTSVNVIVVEGGVVREPEIKYTPEGLGIARFAIANSSISFKDGQKSEEVSYFEISAFGKLAEICSTYLKKGRKVIISGKLRQNRWKTDDGQNRSNVKIVANDVKFMPSSKPNYQKKP
jgi:single-strand DNA-binding protein